MLVQTIIITILLSYFFLDIKLTGINENDIIIIAQDKNK